MPITRSLCKTVFLGALGCAGSGVFAPAAFAQSTQPEARIELCTGSLQIARPDKSQPAGNFLPAGTNIQTGNDTTSRCRIALGEDSIIHLGPATSVRFDSGRSLTLGEGQLVAYAMPGISPVPAPVILHIHSGVLKLEMGKIFAESGKEKQQIAVFNDLVSATWQDGGHETVLYPGNLLNIASSSPEITLVPRNMETQTSDNMSPELPAVQLATAAYQHKDFTVAARLFREIQHAFPYNAAAAYHLGVLELNAGKTEGAARQWRKYAEIDPAAANAKGILKQLTLITKQTIRDEVKQAIAQEKSLSRQTPEPNSIAVNPLINKGAETYNPIGKGLTAFVITDLMKVPGLKVLEREKLQTLIDEIKLSEAGGLVEKNSRLRADRIMRAEKLMIGEYVIEPDKEGRDVR